MQISKQAHIDKYSSIISTNLTSVCFCIEVFVPHTEPSRKRYFSKTKAAIIAGDVHSDGLPNSTTFWPLHLKRKGNETSGVQMFQ